MNPRPLWRWWLFCIALDLWWRFQWEWARELFGWCVLPEWVCDPSEFPAEEVTDGPF